MSYGFQQSLPVMKTESTWMQGVKAYRAGVPIRDCPYRSYSDYNDKLDRDGWVNGWTYAQNQSKEST